MSPLTAAAAAIITAVDAANVGKSSSEPGTPTLKQIVYLATGYESTALSANSEQLDHTNINSGASHNMCLHEDWFDPTTIQKLVFPIEIATTNSEIMIAEKEGTMLFYLTKHDGESMCLLRENSLCPGSRHNSHIRPSAFTP